MNKFNTLTPAPLRVMARPARIAKRAPMALMTTLMLQAATLFLAVEFVPHVGDLLGHLFGHVEQGLSLAQNRI